MPGPPALSKAVLVGAMAALGLAAGAMRAEAAGRGELDHLVILLRPSEVDELTREALARITGELAAARFRVVVFPLDAGADPIEQVDSVGGDLEPVAAFALVRAPDGYGGSVELWISDRLAHRTTIQRMRLQDGDVSRAAEVLAVESVELIRISLAALWPRPAPEPPPPAPPPATPPPRAEASLSLGMSVLRDGGVAANLWAPIVRVAYRWPNGLGVFAAARGFGRDIELDGTDGSALVRRQEAWLGLAETLFAGRRFQPMLSLGGGVEHVSAAGSAADPMHARSKTSWSGLLSAGGGLVATVIPHIAVVLDVEGMLFLPKVAVRVGDVDTVFALPSVLVDVGLRASF